MATLKEALAATFRGIERRLGVDRDGRTVWVWLLPPAIGIVSAVLVAFMPGLPNDVGWVYRLPFSFFALVTMTLIASIYLITFDNDHNQQAAVDDGPERGDDGPGSPPSPSGSPPPAWLSALDKPRDAVPVHSDPADGTARRERVPTEASR
jgi:hypothetical protein